MNTTSVVPFRVHFPRVGTARRLRTLGVAVLLGLASTSAEAADQTVTGNMTVTGNTLVSGTTASTSKDTGTLVLEGGAGVEGDIFAGGNVSATMLIASGGTLTGGATGLTLAAGGTNQNITLTPGGTGQTIVSSLLTAPAAFVGPAPSYAISGTSFADGILKIGVGTYGTTSVPAISIFADDATALPMASIGIRQINRGGHGAMEFKNTGGNGYFVFSGPTGYGGVEFLGGTAYIPGELYVGGRTRIWYDSGATKILSYLQGVGTPGGFSLAAATDNLGGTADRLTIDSAGAVNIPNALTVGGNMTVSGAFSAANFASAAVTAPASTNLALSAGSGNQSITLTPSGTGTIQAVGNTSVAGALGVTGTLGVTGNATLGTVAVGNNLNVAGTTTLMGNVGIGTANVGAKLQVDATSAGAVANTLRLMNASGSTGTGSSILFSTNSDSIPINMALVAGGSSNGTLDGYLAFSTSKNNTLAERLRIDATGNVGIGTATPSSKLEVAGDLRVSGSNFYLGPTGSSDMLAIQHVPSGTSTEFRVMVGDNFYEPSEQDRLAIGSTSFQDGVWHPSMTVLGSGGVGIGTSTPTAKLEVVGNATISGQLNTGSLVIAGQTFDPLFYLRKDTAGVIAPGTLGTYNYTEGLRINDAANGYSMIHLGGNATSGTGSNQWAMVKDPAGKFSVRENGVDRLAINPSTGATQISGNLTVTGSSVTMPNATTFQPMASDLSRRQIVSFTATGPGWYRVLDNSSSSLAGYGKFGKMTVRYGSAVGSSIVEVNIGTSGYAATNNLTLVNAWRYNAQEPSKIRATANTSNVDSGIDLYLSAANGDSVTVIFEGVTGTPVAAPVVGATAYANSRVLDTSTGAPSLATTGAVVAGNALTVKTESDVSGDTTQLTLGANPSIPQGGAILKSVRTSGAGSNTDLAIQTTNSGVQTEAMRVTAAGSVGVGTTTPAARHDVFGVSAVTGGTGHDFAVQISGVAPSVPGLYSGFSGGSSWLRSENSGAAWLPLKIGANVLQFYTNGGIERVRIDATGNIGIGTTTPTAKLDVNGDTKVTGNLTVTGNASINALSIGGTAFVPSEYLKVSGTGNVTVGALTASNGTVTGSTSAGLTLSAGAAGKDLVLNPDGAGTGDVIIPAGNTLKMNDAAPTMRVGQINLGTDTTGAGVEVPLVEFGSASDAGSLHGVVNGTGDLATWKFGYRTRDGQGADTFTAGLTLLTGATGATSLTSGGGLALSAGGTNQNITLAPSGTGFLDVQSSEIRGKAGATDYLGLRLGANTQHGIWMHAAVSADGATVTADDVTTFRAFGGADKGYSFWTGGATQVERFRITNSYSAFLNGNVGIGTTTPSEKLVVSGNQRFTNMGPGTGIFADNGSNAGLFSLTRQDTVTTGDLSISAFGGIGLKGGSQAYNNAVSSGYSMYVAASGNVGIGTTTPGQKLDVFGTGAAFDTSSDMRVYINRNSTANIGSLIFTTGGVNVNNGYAEIGQGGTSNGDLYFKANPNAGNYQTRMLIQASTGNVGIGTTTPTAKLDVNGDAKIGTALTVAGNTTLAATTVNSTLNVTGATTMTTLNAGAITGSSLTSGVVTGSTNGLALNAGGTDKNITLTPSGTGKVVVTSTSSSAKLDLAATGATSSYLTLAGSSTASSTEARINFYQPTAPSGLRRWRMGTGGATAYNGPNQFRIDRLADDEAQVSSTPLTIDTNDYVGLGTITPTARLDVAGTTKLGGAVTATGDVAITSGTTSTSSATGALKVTGGAGITENLNVGGSLGLNGSAAVGGTVTVAGNVSSTSSATGTLIVTGGAGVSGAINVGGNATITGTAQINSNVGIGTTPTSNKLEVAGNTRITGALDVTGAVNAGSVAASTGAVTGSSIYGLVLKASSSGNANVNIDASGTGFINIGGGGGTGEVKLGSSQRNVQSATLLPLSAGAYDIGANASRWRNAYFSGTVVGNSFTSESGTIQGVSNGLYLAAGGGNASVTVKPSGTGSVQLDGNVAIGTTAPASLTVQVHGTGDRLAIYASDNNHVALQTVLDGNSLTSYTGNSTEDRLLLQPRGGSVGIGTQDPGNYRLAVNGSIRAKEVVVESGWADYVFDENYRNAPLSEVEAHIKEHKHLPGVPSAAEVAEKGVSLGQVQAVLLSKIEELTLHMIEQEKRIKRLENENAALRGDNR